jgi:hypothetical protein
MKEYTFIPDDTHKTLWERVNQWFDESPAKSMFADAKGICKAGVAEYLANQDGHTIYASMAKRDEAWYVNERTKEVRDAELKAEAERIAYEKREVQRKKDETLYQSAASKLTPSELHVLQKRFGR